MPRFNKGQLRRLLSVGKGPENAYGDRGVVIGGYVKKVIFPGYNLGPGAIDVQRSECGVKFRVNVGNLVIEKVLDVLSDLFFIETTGHGLI